MPEERSSSGRTELAGLGQFSILASGQVASVFGSHLTSFVLGVWVYQQNGSATAFSLIYFFAIVPEIVLAPVAGTLVDRWDRRKAMLLSDAGAGLISGVVLALAWTGRLEVGHIYVLTALASTCQSLQFPALTASTTLLVPKRHLIRANGVLELGFALVGLAGPAAAGFLLSSIGLEGVILIDLVTFVVAVVSLCLVRIPSHLAGGERSQEQPSVVREAREGWLYIQRRGGLMALLVLFAALNFTLGMVKVSITPLVLSFASAAVLGTVMSAAGGGLAAGSLTVTLWGGPKRAVRAILLFLGCQGGILFLGGVEPNAVLIAAAVFSFTYCTPIIYASSQSIWQRKVDPALQGRVFAMRRMVAWSSLPLSYLVAGPLVDEVFEPLLMPGGALAGSVGRWIGVGPGRGVGLLFMVLGCLALTIVALATMYTPLRRLEEELPDAIGEDEGQRLSGMDAENAEVHA